MTFNSEYSEINAFSILLYFTFQFIKNILLVTNSILSIDIRNLYNKNKKKSKMHLGTYKKFLTKRFLGKILFFQLIQLFKY